LIRCGAFDSLGAYRSQLIAIHEMTLDSVMQERKRNIAGQVSLFGEITPSEPSNYQRDHLPNLEEFPMKMLLTMEKEMTGVYISGHPLDEYKNALEGYSTTMDIMELQNIEGNNELTANLSNNLKDGSTVTLGGLVMEKKIKYTKNNNAMAFVTLEDLYGMIEVIVFPQVLQKYSSLLEEDKGIVIKGRISMREEEEPKLIANEVEALVNEKPSKLYLMISSDQNSKIQKDISHVLKKYKGNIPVYLYVESMKKTFRYQPDLWIRRDSGLLKELSSLLGEKCVKMV
ncbi:MAG: DNA polymerase III subunit alpha, partial [Clostridiales bacterium]|nr:DNA polymerase III subunit alpha [Clostridiales bacterium]